MTEHEKYYSAFFVLNKEEKEKFGSLLAIEYANIRHGIFITSLYKELSNDLAAMFRIINIGVMEGSINRSVITNLKNLTKEAIVLSNYNKYLSHIKDTDGVINMVQLSKLNRFKLVGISRLFILRTLQKYDIKYTTIKDVK